MTNHHYRPGRWHAAASPRCVAVLPPDIDGDVAAAIWTSLDGGAGFGGVLEALAARFGATFANIPPFAIVELSETEARIAVRGTPSVRTCDAGGAAVEITGANVTTWSERTLPRGEAITIELTDAGAPAPGGEWLPIASGVVLASAFLVGDRTAAASAATVPPATVPAPEPTAVPPARESAPAAAAAVGFGAAAQAAQAAQTPSAAAPAAAVPDETISDSRFDTVGPDYDALWGATVARTVDSAAVHEEDDEPLEPEPRRTAPAAAEPAAEPEPEPEAPAAPLPAPAHVGAVSAGPQPSWVPPVLLGEAPPPTAAPAPAPAPTAAPDPGDANFTSDGDHDGATIARSELRGLRGQASVSPIDPQAGQPAPVRYGTVSVSTGAAAPIDGIVVLGRKPAASRVGDGVEPRLITVPSPGQDISRSHVELRLDGTAVLATDLHTTNGTRLLRPGQEPFRLPAGEPTVLLSGDVLDLGDGVTAELKDLP